MLSSRKAKFDFNLSGGTLIGTFALTALFHAFTGYMLTPDPYWDSGSLVLILAYVGFVASNALISSWAFSYHTPAEKSFWPLFVSFANVAMIPGVIAAAIMHGIYYGRIEIGDAPIQQYLRDFISFYILILVFLRPCSAWTQKIYADQNATPPRLRNLAPRERIKSVVLTFIFILGTALINMNVLAAFPSYSFFYSDYEEDSGDAAKPTHHAEDVWPFQPSEIAAATKNILPGVKGQTDAYLIAMGGYGTQNVFLREAQKAQEIFDTEYNTKGRSVLLVNNSDEPRKYPLASISTLANSLRAVAEKMNLDEDVLVLYMTSHGSEGSLSMSLPYVPIHDISPTHIANVLDRNKIKWRIIIISACHSGSFIAPLKNDNTLILTAAASDKTSFGCSDEEDLTFFGHALFEEGLPRTSYLPHAFSIAQNAIARWEKAGGLTPSDPQIFLGAEMEKKIQGWPRKENPDWTQFLDQPTKFTPDYKRLSE